MIRNLTSILSPNLQKEGGGFLVRRPIGGNTEVGKLFLLFDHLEFKTAPNSDFPGPMHPHRGFETVSYNLQGAYKHTCLSGVEGNLYPGDAQWMTAGRGVVHGASSEENFRRTGGVMEGFQIWVNLPKVDKMVAPRYQDVRSADIPVVAVEGAQLGSSVKVITGEYNGIHGACSTLHPVSVLDVRLQPGDEFTVPTNSDHVAFVYVYRGTASFGSSEQQRALTQGQGSVPSSGSSFRASVSDNVPLIAMPAPHGDSPAHTQAGAAFLLLMGQPIDEPLVRSGPFVMNTQQELEQCYADYRSGKMAAESKIHS